MVWVGISANGVTRPFFVKPGVKINKEYYIKKILEPFIRVDAKKLYPNGDFVFHQDSAPSHSAKKTREFLANNKIKYITPEEWMPNSPDAAPCDFFLWGYLKKRIAKRKVSTIASLKNAIRDELKKVPQEKINNALKAWPKRCLQIYNAKGHQIEKLC